MSEQKPVTPADFGPARHGIHLFAHDDDWGWTAYGHDHEPRRIVAACAAEARSSGVLADLGEVVAPKDIIEGVRRKWAVQVDSDYYDFEIEFCDQATPGAVPVTVVIP